MPARQRGPLIRAAKWVLSAGWAAARYAAEGHKLFFCVSTNGNVGSPTLSAGEIAAIRRKEAQKGADIVGARLIWLDFDDEFLFDTRESRLKFIEAFRPSYRWGRMLQKHLLPGCTEVSNRQK